MTELGLTLPPRINTTGFALCKFNLNIRFSVYCFPSLRTSATFILYYQDILFSWLLDFGHFYIEACHGLDKTYAQTISLRGNCIMQRMSLTKQLTAEWTVSGWKKVTTEEG